MTEILAFLGLVARVAAAYPSAVRALLLTALLSAPLAALSPDREARNGVVERELPLIIYKGRDLKRPAMAPQMKVALVKASGPTRRLVGLFARKRAENCGVCPARVDEDGVHCNRRDGLWNNCGQERLLARPVRRRAGRHVPPLAAGAHL